ncbi:SidA/IucD/PvdA family monooxygenase [Massilia sp. CCM 8733]|uniref:SidA/IucD/PvdA family monooxygenase n=1 Tax=Massilia mucilaginosa TaxID=2609282 RepID=A0ABX0P0Z4_9BURK|nr:SidA/IucD/PvdA family monooxygenase [Massilia mucilaginosa]NHZ92964.1 SidA/IucD/PvdA family monooxygenase [Massilia mucilaginosa]
MTDRDLSHRRLAVVGGGPKAVALAVKARVLKSLKQQDTEVVIFEKNSIGAAWEGNHGFSDGEQQLCTLAERDLGFPYKSMYGARADEHMLNYSRQRFLLSRAHAYSNWVDAGRKPPKHKMFTLYLRWALKRAHNIPVSGKVTQVHQSGTQWVVEYENSKGASVKYEDPFDGVVMTGPGPARPLQVQRGAGQPATCSRIFNGEDFWLRLSEVKALIARLGTPASAEFDTDILIVGGGGTAAATLAWRLSNGCMSHAIEVVATRAVLHTRVDSLFENRLFSEEETWKTLSADSQDEVFNRLNRGVVWATVIDKVSAADSLTVRDGKVKCIEIGTFNGREQLSVTMTQGNGTEVVIKPHILIDATGFDARWFKALLPQWPAGVRDDDLETSLGDELQYMAPYWNLPLLHAPMLSKRVGPGFASLMVLGGMSDRILRAYR